MKLVEPGTFGRNRVDVWRLHDRVSVTAKPIGPLLVNHDVQKIWFSGHILNLWSGVVVECPVPVSRFACGTIIVLALFQVLASSSASRSRIARTDE